MLALFAQRLPAPQRRAYFWMTLTLFAATPMYFAASIAALPDHLLLLGTLTALYFLSAFLGRWSAAAPGGYRDLYLGAGCIGLAMLAKYNAAFLGIGLLVLIVVSPRLRPLLGRPQPYLAALLVLLLQAPVIAWNAANDFASFRFILGGRHQGLAASWDGTAGFLLGALAFFGPFLLPALLRFATGSRPIAGDGLPRAVFFVSTLGIVAVSLFTSVLFHWNLVAYTAALPFLAFQIRRRLVVWLHVVFGTAFLIGMIVNFTLVPVLTLVGRNDEASAWMQGWAETADAVAAARMETGAELVAASDYTVAALLGFAMRDPDVTSLDAATDQFDFWFGAEAHRGEDAIVVVDSFRPLPVAVQRRFASLTLLTRLAVERHGRRIDTHEIYIGRGYRPPGTSAGAGAMQ